MESATEVFKFATHISHARILWTPLFQSFVNTLDKTKNRFKVVLFFFFRSEIGQETGNFFFLQCVPIFQNLNGLAVELKRFLGRVGWEASF